MNARSMKEFGKKMLMTREAAVACNEWDVPPDHPQRCGDCPPSDGLQVLIYIGFYNLGRSRGDKKQ